MLEEKGGERMRLESPDIWETRQDIDEFKIIQAKMHTEGWFKGAKGAH